MFLVLPNNTKFSVLGVVPLLYKQHTHTSYTNFIVGENKLVFFRHKYSFIALFRTSIASKYVSTKGLLT